MMPNSTEATTINRDRQIKYFAYCLKHLQSAYDKLDTNRLTLVHFAVQSLDLLGMIPESDESSADNTVPEDPVCVNIEELRKRKMVDRQAIIEWTYGLQTRQGGFLGGTFLGPCLSEDDYKYGHGHIAMAYTALCILATLGDDLSRVDRHGMIESLRRLQRDDGSFQCVEFGSEHDMRFVYCACAISYMLQDWSGVDQDKAVDFIRACQSYDGGFALIPGQEGHGGSTFCAVASLMLMNRMDVLDGNQNDGDNSAATTTSLTSPRSLLIHWCVHRQVGGMQGRPNKKEDTCYSYWIGGTLALLEQHDLLNQTALFKYILQCETHMGGFSKLIGTMPDVLHSFYSLAWLSLSSSLPGDDESEAVAATNEERSNDEEQYEQQLRQLNCTLGICQDRLDVFDLNDDRHVV